MRLPPILLRRKLNVHKNDFGHILILAGSPSMLGAAALSSLAAMRSGAGLVTVGIPQSLNRAVQKKISAVVMTWPLAETVKQTLAVEAYPQNLKRISFFDAVAIGPGVSTNKSTQRLILKIVSTIDKPLVIDADALTALATNAQTIRKHKGIMVLTPHPGEMARLTGLKKNAIENNRKKVALEFAAKYNCTFLLKGHRTVVASPQGQFYINKTGNPGMATAGSGDVLTGMIAACLGQGLPPFEAAKLAAYFHGKAGDLAAKEKTKTAMIAADIIDKIPLAFRRK